MPKHNKGPNKPAASEVRAANAGTDGQVELSAAKTLTELVPRGLRL
jgi:hypothetical protein